MALRKQGAISLKISVGSIHLISQSSAGIVHLKKQEIYPCFFYHIKGSGSDIY